LTEAERGAADDQMIDLVTLLPQNPGEEKLSAMLTAALNGTSYDDGKSSSTLNLKKASSKPAPKAQVEDDNIPEEVSTPVKTPKVEAEGAQEFSEHDAEAKQILESIRSRMKKKAE
jgi:hypothetical protein